MKVECVCPTCKKGFVSKEFESRPRKKFCSRECKDVNNWSEEQKFEVMKTSFEKNVIRKDGCWEWKGYKDINGYSKMSCRRVFGSIFAHRISWIINKGLIPEGMLICHHCDNPECTNPDHLFLGLPRDNSADMVDKKRQALGYKNCKAKLDETQVTEIKKLLDKKIPMNKIAKQYSVHQASIEKIKYGQTWKHVNP